MPTAAAPFLSVHERGVLAALGDAVTPPGRRVGPVDGDRLDRAERLVADLGPTAATGYRGMLAALEHGARLAGGRPFSQLEPFEKVALLERLGRLGPMHFGLYALTAPLKYAATHDPGVYARIGAPFGVATARSKPEPWESRITDLSSLERDEHLECDVVIIGSGAGGAPLAKKLAQRGLAVVILEEGAHHTRRDFDGHALPAVRKLYRGGGTLAALGNAVIPVFAGRTTGGSTTINSGTCFRAPPEVLRAWVEETGASTLGPDALAPHFESVEHTLRVAPNPMDVLGGNARVVARGASRLGWSHAPLPRNAPGCDGQGICCFGCPTDAKQSTLVAYLPRALSAGAMLFSGARVDRILTRGGRVVGVVAEAARGGSDGSAGELVRLRVSARTVVVAGGAVPTPVLLLRNGLANGSGQVGRNLSLHPASYGMALFEERVDGFRAVPQGYGVHEFADRGLMLEGLFVPPDITAASFPGLGRDWTALVDRMEHLAAFGFMIRDTSRGRVRAGPGGRPLITYYLNERDRRLVLEGHARVAEIFLAAGAIETRPGVSDMPPIRNERELLRFVERGPDRYKARDLGLTAYHPLGSCRMGADPRRSVVRADHRSHDVEGLYVVDGSVLPGPPGVNPQVTIMALAEQAAGPIGEAAEALDKAARAAARLEKKAKAAQKARLHVAGEDAPSVSMVEKNEDRDKARPAAQLRRAWVFSEVMAGSLREVDEAVSRDLTLTLDVRFVHLADQLRCLIAGGGRLCAELSGTADLGGLAHARPATGHLTWAPLGGRAALVYEVAFALDDGTRVLARGEKHVLLPRVLRGATTLHTALQRVEGDRAGEVLARGILRFGLWTMPGFLRSFALKRPVEID